MEALIIDDDPVHHKITGIYLKKCSAVSKFKCYLDPAYALRELMETYYESRSLPEVILLDIKMPVVNGWAFLDVLNSFIIINNLNTHVYIITSSIDPFDELKTMLYSCIKGYYVKPVSGLMIDEIIRKYGLK